jgi:putative glutamine amidotransferase
MQVPGLTRPRIGLLADRRAASFGAWNDVELSFVWNHYVEALDHAGGAPLVFPTVSSYGETPGLALDLVDGLLLTGGRDLDASSYGEDPDPANEPGDAERDRIELALAREGFERDLPILGVCRGMQLLNLVLGGGVDQHLADPDSIHRGQPGAFTSHDVEIVPGSRLASIAGSARATVRSHHHQGVAPLADPFTAVAHAPDGLVEAAEVADRTFCLAVLWHPEQDLDGGGRSLYEALVAAAGGSR